jgi:inosose dehydratase
MSILFSRRRFVAELGTVAAAYALPLRLFGPRSKELLGPSIVTSHLISPSKNEPNIRFGYAAITWGGKDEQAIQEISEIGFRGIQLRSNVLEKFGERPSELRALLDHSHLEMVALSSGGVGISPGTEKSEIARHVRNAQFVKDVGGKYLQVTDSARPKDRQPTAADYKQLGSMLTEIGKRVTDLGIPLGYHNHMGSLGEAPDQVDHIMDAADQRYVKFELDIAHYQQGGGNPAKAIRRYHDRLLFLHIKDVESLSSPDREGRAYRFVELGRGRVDLPAVFSALKDVGFNGWAVVELDSVPDPARTPKECAIISKKYLEDKLSLKI